MPREQGKNALFVALLCILWSGTAAAAGSLPTLVQDIGYSLLLAGLLAVIFSSLRIPSIAAFLIAGVIAGPLGAHFVSDPDNIDTIAQLGLVLLLFLIGLEFNFRKLMASGRIVLITGALQFPLCVALGIGLTKLLIWAGVGLSVLAPGGDSGYTPLYVGFVLAASSTLLVIKLYQDAFQLDTTVGRVSMALLIFQDIWAIVILAVQPSFAAPQLQPILMSFLGIGIVAMAAVLLSHYVLSQAFRKIAKLPELILVTAVGWCFGLVLFGANLDLYTLFLFDADWHLSVGPGMCALIAGASIANLPCSADVVSKVGVVKEFFVTLFFVALGMGIPMPDGAEILGLAVLLAVFALAARYLVFFPLLYWTGLDRRNAFVSSTRLAQVSEFSLVIAYTGLGLGHISSEFNALIILAFVLTALMTPLLFKQADRLHEFLSPWLTGMGFRLPLAAEEKQEANYKLALLGFHRLASSLLYELQRQQSDILSKTLVVDFNVNLHKKIAAQGPKVCYGDLASIETLQHAGVARAETVMIAVQDDLLKGTSNRRIVEIVRHINPQAAIIASAMTLSESRALYEAGADYVFLARVEGAKGLLPALEHAMCGTLADYRSSREAAEGYWYQRAEVLD